MSYGTNPMESMNEMCSKNVGTPSLYWPNNGISKIIKSVRFNNDVAPFNIGISAP